MLQNEPCHYSIDSPLQEKKTRKQSSAHPIVAKHGSVETLKMPLTALRSLHFTLDSAHFCWVPSGSKNSPSVEVLWQYTGVWEMVFVQSLCPSGCNPAGPSSHTQGDRCNCSLMDTKLHQLEPHSTEPIKYRELHF